MASERRQAMFAACLLEFGPPPQIGREYSAYVGNIRDWYRNFHKGYKNQPKDSSMYAFINQYFQWIDNHVKAQEQEAEAEGGERSEKEAP